MIRNIFKLAYCIIMWPVCFLLEYTIGLFGVLLIPRKERSSVINNYRDSWRIIRTPWNTYDITRGL